MRYSSLATNFERALFCTSRVYPLSPFHPSQYTFFSSTPHGTTVEPLPRNISKMSSSLSPSAEGAILLPPTNNVTISSINERSSQSLTDPSVSSSLSKLPLSTLLHTAFGMDHYPGYLLKWSINDLQNYERILQAQLRMVQESTLIVQQREEHIQSYTPLHIFTKENVLEWINKDIYTIVSSLSSLSSSRKLGKISHFLTEEGPGIYSFPLLSKEGCDRILEEVEHFSEWEYQQSLRLRKIKYNSTLTDSSSSSTLVTNFGSNRRNIPLHACGLDIVQDLLFQYIVQPLYTVLYPDLANAGTTAAKPSNTHTLINNNDNRLDYRYGYVIGYADRSTATAQLSSRSSSSTSSSSSSVDEKDTTGGLQSLLTRNSLRKHTDDSEITLNISLGKEFSGGDLIMKGLRNSLESEEIIIHPEIGKAILHLGQHIHEVTPVVNGERYSLIMWSRSSSYRKITCPCCMIHRRTECICDNSWTT